MYDCFDTHGEKIPRAGVASVKRVLKELVNPLDSSDDCWATVSCPKAGVYLTRHYDEYEVSQCIKEGCASESESCTTQRKAIDRFLELRQSEMDKCLE